MAGAGPLRAGPGAGWASGPLARRSAWVAIAIVVLAAGAWFVVRRLAHGPLAIHGVALASDPIARMDPETVFRTAESMNRAGRDVASLPYYRQAVRNVRADFWQLHFNYGTALYNATFELETRHGLPVYAVRSSWERVAFMREAAHELLDAERLARTPRDLALVRSTRARTLWLWGLPWETFAAYREAQSADPADRALGLQADRYMDLMRSPAAYGLADPGTRAPTSR